MARRKKTPTTDINLTDPQYYFNREVSWLEFNNRVLHEAFDPRTPLLERLKFLAIFSANLDEFFMVRVAALKQQVEAEVTKLSPDGKSPQEQLDLISQRLRPMVVKQHQHFEQALRPLLAAQGIHLLDYIDLNQEQRKYLQRYYEEQIFPVLTPLAIDPGHPFPYISNLSINLAVVIKDPVTGEELYARVKAPNILPRFLPLPEELRVQQKDVPAIWTAVPLEQVIAHNLESLFPGMNIQEYYPFRITRDTDLELEEDEADDLLLAIEQELRKRRFGGSIVRLEVHATMPETVREMLRQEMDLGENDVYEAEGILCLRDLFALTDLPLPELRDPAQTSTVPSRLRKGGDASLETLPVELEEDFFAVLRKHDVMVHHPYHSFSSTVQRFITQAAYDPNVLAIKMTLYRTSGDSPIVNALIAAAENGKQVSALVELKARFDEENNINWARKLESVGVHVVYGLVGLKTHTKVVLVVRREDDRIRRYVHIGTGNYNPKTARLYTDVGLLSCREELGADLTDLFNYLTGYSRQQSYRRLLVAPVNLRDRMIALIQRESAHAAEGHHARIVAKMNSLIDPIIITNLYQASQAGVQIDLIVRGMCCLRPQLPGISDNIRVISIVGRFLEHSRIFYFHNRGEEEVFIGSADWMPRNLDRRVEAVVPIEDRAIAKDLQEILGVMLADNRQAWDLQPDGRYVQRRPTADSPEQSSQRILMELAHQHG
ncbi:polyphosphate kinase 1 [Leptothermofonsia sichuanensis E412]|uniref:polyphosphate kinase 1 n=1 Tax=Leptothermofonsia sichuanensis TaxID=2917832 RepID=UPI001CA727A9|nr:polyphosphate kinase 1 [Leptothermofonsia sichuanensis]QZZ19783.1 polyphosphate kinase 1 [Leptothermofonsia sichuanensis E412]